MSEKTKVVQLPPGGEGSHEALATATGELNNGLFEIADAIRELSKEHAKSIDNLAQTIRWSFMDDWDNNVPNKLEQLAHALKENKE